MHSRLPSSLPSHTHPAPSPHPARPAGGSELPILPVMPGRINALAAAATPPAPLPASAPATAATTTSFSADSGSERGGSGAVSPPTGAADAAPPHLRARTAYTPSAAYTPSGRTQQLFQLLEQQELRQQAQQQQQAAADAGGGGGGASSGSAPPTTAGTAGTSGAGVKRSSSATAALDALALLAEAEAESAVPAAEPPRSRMVSAF